MTDPEHARRCLAAFAVLAITVCLGILLQHLVAIGAYP